MARGIIANPTKHQVSENTISIGDQITPEDVRFFLLYWDRIVVPASNQIYVEVPDEKILIEQGYLERPMDRRNHGFLFNSSMVNSFLLEQLKSAQQYQEKDKDTDWVLHQFSDELYLGDNEIQKNRSLRLTLAKMLPVPNQNISITDVIDFKERRRQLFDAFHDKMDQVYIEAIKCPDQSLGFYRAKKELEEVLEELEKLSNEKWQLLKRVNWSASFNLDIPTLTGISSMAYAAYSSSSTPEMSAFIGAAGALLSIGAKLTSVSEWNKNKPILAYLNGAVQEGLIKP